MPSRICIHYARKSGRPSSGHRTGKGQSSSQFPRRVLPKNVLTIKQLHSSLKLVWSYLKSCMLGFSIMQTKNFQMSSWVSKRKRNFRDHIANVRWVIEKAREFQKNISLCSSATLKPLTVSSDNIIFAYFIWINTGQIHSKLFCLGYHNISHNIENNMQLSSR